MGWLIEVGDRKAHKLPVLVAEGEVQQMEGTVGWLLEAGRRKAPKLPVPVAEGEVLIEAKYAYPVNCGACGFNDWWLQGGRRWVCGVCHPQPRNKTNKVRGEGPASGVGVSE